MRYLGIDYGERWVGLAVSDRDGKFAFPRETLANDEKLGTAVARLIRDENIERIILGDTRALSGAANAITPELEEFAQWLRTHTTVPVETTFEAWSTQEAARYAPSGKMHDDSAAAAIILQRYLDMHRPGIE